MSYVTIRIWEETRRLLRLIAADSGEQMVEVLHRLCEQEWSKTRDKSQNTSQSAGDKKSPSPE